MRFADTMETLVNATFRHDKSHHRDSLLVAGSHFMPTLRRLAVSSDEIEHIWNRLMETIHPGDFVILLLVAFGTVPLCSALFGYRALYKKSEATTEQEKAAEMANGEDKQKTYLYHCATLLEQAARLMVIVYLAECVVVILQTAGFSFENMTRKTHAFAKMMYIIWIAQRLSVFKRYLLAQATGQKSETLGKAALVDKILDGVLMACTSLFLMDVLNVEMGAGMSSLFAFGSAGTLVVGLATQNLATMFVNGLTLNASNRIEVGDAVTFGDGTEGIVKKIGWMQTVIQGYDEVSCYIPNSELGMMRVKNLSRVNKCQVKVFLRFHYEDIDKLGKLCNDILDEIKNNVPECISDGSAVFRAVWSDFKEDHVVVMVDTHYNLPCMGQVYWENRMKVLQLINEAVKKNDMKFVTTFYPPTQLVKAS